MNDVLEVAVIADDLTGAADTGVQFCRAVGPVWMTASDAPQVSRQGRITAGLAVFTNTRHMSPEEAGEILGAVGGKIRHLGPRVVYKKIDSCLRGNLGPEIEALILALGYTASFVAPALPEQGRITKADVHMVNGVPVAETEIGRDPLCPVQESRLSVLLSRQCRMRVGHVPLECIEKGPPVLAAQVHGLLNAGCRHIAFDAARPAHLDAVAALACDHFKGILLVGSAGLAAGKARTMMSTAPAAVLCRPKLKRPLFVCGSSSGVLTEQRERLAQHSGFTREALDPSVMADPDGFGMRKRVAEGLAALWLKSGMILCISPLPHPAPAGFPDRVIRGFAEVADIVIGQSTPDGLFLSGGDTAEAVWRRVGAEAILLVEEILPGLARGEFAGGRVNGFPVVTKAGAFGPPQILVELQKLLS